MLSILIVQAREGIRRREEDPEKADRAGFSYLSF
jgi:hypothetical protein